MAVISNTLWSLINSMSPAERLYFRRDFVSDHKKEISPLFLKVFDLVAKQKEYDEGALLRKLKPAIHKKNISYVKNYLYQTLCDALSSLYQSRHPKTAFYKDVVTVRMLKSKNLIPAAAKLCKKLLERAVEMEDILLYQRVMEEYRKITLYHSPTMRYEVMVEVFEETNKAIHEYTEQLERESLFYQALLLRRKSHFKLSVQELQEVNQLLNHPLMQREPASLPFLTWHYYHMAYATLLYLKGDPAAATITKNVIETWLRHPQQIEDEPENFIEALYLFNYAGVRARMFDEVETIMLQPFSNQIASISLRSYCEIIQYLSLLRVYHKTARYDEVNKIAHKIKNNLPAWEPFISDELKKTALVSVGISSFVTNELEDAFYLVKKMLLDFNDHSREEHYSFAHLFLLLICFEMKNPVMFDHQLNQTAGYFYKKKNAQPFEKIIVQSLKRMIQPMSAQERKNEFKILLQELDQTADNILQQRLFELFNFPLWIRSKIAGIPYVDMVRQTLISV